MSGIHPVNYFFLLSGLNQEHSEHNTFHKDYDNHGVCRSIPLNNLTSVVQIMKFVQSQL